MNRTLNKCGIYSIPGRKSFERFDANPPIALFLDFDGTLVPLQARPEDVWLDDATRRTLSRLVRSPRFRVWIMSGRRRADVRARVRVPGIRYLGLHGWEGRNAEAITEEARRRRRLR